MRGTSGLIVCGLLLGVLGFLGCQKLDASPPTERPVEQEMKSLPGELIIQFEPETGGLLEQMLKKGTDGLSTGLDWLDQLNRQFNVSRIEPLYPQSIDLEAIKKKFPERAKRAPRNTDKPDPNYTYIFHFKGKVDLEAARKAYTARPQVKYAQPNQIIRIPNQE